MASTAVALAAAAAAAARARALRAPLLCCQESGGRRVSRTGTCKAVTWRRRICLQATARPLSRLLRCLPSPPLPLSWGRSHPPVRRTERTAVRSSPFVGLFPTGISGAPPCSPSSFSSRKDPDSKRSWADYLGKPGSFQKGALLEPTPGPEKISRALGSQLRVGETLLWTVAAEVHDGFLR